MLAHDHVTDERLDGVPLPRNCRDYFRVRRHPARIKKEEIRMQAGMTSSQSFFPTRAFPVVD